MDDLLQQLKDFVVRNADTQDDSVQLARRLMLDAIEALSAASVELKIRGRDLDELEAIARTAGHDLAEFRSTLSALKVLIDQRNLMELSLFYQSHVEPLLEGLDEH